MIWTCWKQEGDLCRAEGPDSSSPGSGRHPVTSMNVTSRAGGGGVLSSVPNSCSKCGHKMGDCLSLTQQNSYVRALSAETGVRTHDLTEAQIPQNKATGLSEL